MASYHYTAIYLINNNSYDLFKHGHAQLNQIDTLNTSISKDSE